MTSPAKPWEGVGPNLRSSTTFGSPGPLYSSSATGQVPPSSAYRRVARTVDAGRVPPPIPARVGGGAYRQSYPRPAAYSAGSYGMGAYGAGMAGAYGGYGAAYGGGGYGSYGSQMYGSGAYGSGAYGAGAYGMNRYNPHQHGMSSLESRFIQMAEENSRPAFESIESLVQAFGSVSFMMESTFHAMYSSFRAVLGVAENFGRLRSLFGQVFQTFAVLRLFQWIYRKLLYYLGIRHDNPGREAVWKEATGKLDPKTRRTFWPVAMFLSLVCGGPFLVWRLLKSINVAAPPPDSKTTATLLDSSASNPRTWVSGNAPVTLPVAVALYDFTAARDNEMSVRHGQPVWVAPAHLQTPDSDWVLVTINWKECGLVPANFIQVVEHRKYVRPKPKQAVKPPEPLASPEFSPAGATEVAGERAVETPLDRLPGMPDGSGGTPAQAQLPNSLVDDPSQLETAPQPQPCQATGRLEDLLPVPPPPKADGPFEASS